MQLYPFAVILWIYGIKNVWCERACPPPNQSCDCQDSVQGYVYCRGMTSLPRHLPANVTLLDLNSNNVGSELLMKQMEKLGTSSLQFIYLSGNGLESIENMAFARYISLRTIDLSRNNLKRLNGKTFYGLPKLESLFLSESSIVEISPTVFTYVPSLRYLDLASNKLTTVAGEFAALTNLQTLILSGNMITTISDDSFKNLIHLTHLDISGNQLTIPQTKLFDHLVSNNNTAEVQIETTNNRWNCCGLKALEYYDFVASFSPNNAIGQLLDIECSSSSAWAGQMLSDIKRIDVVEMTCGDEIPSASPRIPKRFVVMEESISTETDHGLEFDAITTEVVTSSTRMKFLLSKYNGPDSVNSFSRLSDGQIALVLVAIVVLVIVITAFVVRQCVIEKRKKAFGEFVDNLPNAIEVDEDDTLTTTKTYRHDAPVYGSTGNVIDRHRRKADFASYSASNVKELPSDHTRQHQKRKPPPYEPPSSPEGFAEAYEKPHFNNNASTETATTTDEDFYGYQRMLRRIASCPTEYDSDDGNVLWNIKNVK